MSRRLLTNAFSLPGPPSFYWNAGTLQIPPGATFASAAATRTYFDANGVLQTAAANAPRFNFSGLGVPGNLDGVFLETAVTNLALWNRDFTNAAWVKTTMTAAKDQTGLDGVSSSASSLTATLGNAMALQVITGASASRTISFYLKRIAGSGTIEITQDNGTTWTTAALTTSWQRFQMTQTVTNPTIGIRIGTNGDAVAVDYAQLQTTEVATSPIATTTASVATNSDVLSVPVTGAINNSGCALLVRYVPYYAASIAAAARSIVSVSDGSASNRISTLITASSSLPSGRVTSGGSAVLSSVTTDGTIVAGQENVILVSQNGGANTLGGGAGAYVVSNGGTVKAQTPGANPIGLSTMYLGANDTGASTVILFGCIKEVALYPFNIDGELAARLTTPRL